jgi:RNA-directed DNA polymerase
MSLTTLTSVQKLQTALHAKAKESPDFRFYSLYDKVYRKDVLMYACERCKANGGAAGVDNQTFEDIEQHGLERWLDELAQELKSQTYQPQPVRRVYIPKPDGKQRPLGIPTIRDRVAQTAAMSVLEPIFEADLQPEQYAYRADRSALDAVRHVHKLINTGHRKIHSVGIDLGETTFHPVALGAADKVLGQSYVARPGWLPCHRAI